MFNNSSNHPLIALMLVFVGTTSVASETTMTRSQAITWAMEHNLEIKTALARSEVSQAQARAVWVPLDPEIEAEFEELSSLGTPGNFGERNLGFVQTIEAPFKVWHRKRAASSEAAAVRAAGYEMTRLDVAARVAIAFDRVLSRQQTLSYETDYQSVLQEFAQKAQIRFEAGDVPQLEVLRARVEAGRAASRVVAAHNGLAVSRSELGLLLARDLAPLSLDGTLTYATPEMDLQEVSALGLERRPDLQGAELALRSRRQVQSATRAALLPDLRAGVFRQSLRTAGGTADFWRLAVGLEFPLWGAARQRARMAETRAESAAAESELQRLRQQILLEIDVAHRRVDTAFDQMALYDGGILREAELAQQIALRSYDEGKASYLDVLGAQRDLLETRVAYAGALFTYREAVVALERATGGTLE